MNLKNCWGISEVSGVTFFLERGKPIPPLCPIKEPTFDCPHKTTGSVPVEIKYKPNKIYLTGKRPEIEGVEWNDDVFYWGPKSLKLVEERCGTTRNYVPLILQGVPMEDADAKFFNRLFSIEQETQRPIVVVMKDYQWCITPDFVEKEEC